MINSLQAGRFIAAMAVVLHHAITSVTAFVGQPAPFVPAVLDYGYLGVDFFFVLSGFIIYYTMSLKPRPAGLFMVDRFLRIMLPYWPIAAFLALAYIYVPALSAGNRDWGWASTLTLLPTDLPPALSVAWTLQHEMAFYLIFAIMFFARQVKLGLILWGSAILVGAFSPQSSWPVAKLLLAPINIEFIAGVAAAWLFISGHSIKPSWSLLIAALCVSAFVMSGGNRGESWLVGLSIAAVLPAICKFERDGYFSVPNWLIFGGAASYAIYLTHGPLLSISSRLMNKAGFGWLEALVLSSVLCAGVGIAYFVGWERPVMRMVAQRRRRQRVITTA